MLGASFESLIALSGRGYAQLHEATVHHLRPTPTVHHPLFITCLHHLRTKDGRHEIDLIIQRRDQRIVALEVKLSGAPASTDVRHLPWLREQLDDDLLDAMATTSGARTYKRANGIAVIPAALFGV